MNFYHFSSCSSAMANTIELTQYATNKPLSEHIIHINITELTEITTVLNADTNEKAIVSSNTICQRSIGYICIAIWLALWFGISELIPLLSTEYNKPMFLRYCVGSLMIILLPICYIFNGFKLPKITCNMLCTAFIMNIVYYLGSVCWYISLNSTIAAINNTIYESQLVYAYILSVIFLPNYYGSMIKHISVILCIFGVIIIGIDALNDHSNDTVHNTALGIFEVTLSSFLFAVYEIMVKYFGDKYFKDANKASQLEEIKNMLLMQGLIGLCSLVTIWPFLCIADWIGLEEFELPKTKEDIIGVSIIAIVDLFWATSFILGISFTNPVLMTMSGLLVIPITFIFDVVMYQLSITKLTVIGSLLIVFGFALMETPIVKMIHFKWKFLEVKSYK